MEAPRVPQEITNAVHGGRRNGEPDEGCSEADVESFRRCLGDLVSKADELERRVNDVVSFESNNPPRNPSAGDGRAKKRMNRAQKAVSSKDRMQGLMREFAVIFEQITQHELAYPFREPVDVEGLCLDDYYEIVKKPMDFHTIRCRMRAKDDNGYKHVREIYSDMRLIFTNAMTYNDKKHDYHKMAKKLLDELEKKWWLLLPKVTEEEKRQKEEEAQNLANMQIARESAIAKMARDANNELNELNINLEKLREMVVQKCRKLSTYEKRKLGMDLGSLSREDIEKVLRIIAEDNPSYQVSEDVAEINLESESPLTIWKIKYFVKRALELQAEENACKADQNLKRKKSTSNAVAKPVTKRSRKATTNKGC